MVHSTILNHLQIIAVTGADAQEFLSNQFTSDVNSLAEGEFQLSAWCNPKGRVLFTPILYRNDDDFFCLVPVDMTQQFCQRLTMFVLRAKVSIEPRESHQAISVTITDHAEMAKITNTVTDDPAWTLLHSPLVNDSSNRSAILSAILPSILIGPKQSTAPDDFDWLTTHDEGDWRCTRILAGIPEITSATTEEFLPQQINLDALDGVSFKKGCYPGQEIVARVKYRGKVKQRLFILQSNPAPTDIEALAPLTAVYDLADNKVGQILEACKCEDKQVALAVLDVAFCEQHAEDSETQVAIENVATRFKLTLPPYPIPD